MVINMDSYRTLAEFYDSPAGREYTSDFIDGSRPVGIMYLEADEDVILGLSQEPDDDRWVTIVDDDSMYRMRRKTRSSGSQSSSKFVMGNVVISATKSPGIYRILEESADKKHTIASYDDFQIHAGGITQEEHNEKTKRDLESKSSRELDRRTLARYVIKLYGTYRTSSGAMFNPYLNVLLNLFARIIASDPQFLINVIAHMCDYSLVTTFQILYEPFTKYPHNCVIGSNYVDVNDFKPISESTRDTLFRFTLGLDSNVNGEALESLRELSDVELYTRVLDHAQSRSECLLSTKDGRERVYAAIDEIRIKLMKSNNTKKRVLKTITDNYTALEQTNCIGKLKNVLPSALHKLYKTRPGLKLWQDEIRMLAYNGESEFTIRAPFNQGAYLEYLSNLSTSRPGNNLAEETILLDDSLEMIQFVSTGFTLIHTTDFLFYHQPCNEITDLKREAGNPADLYGPPESKKRYPVVNMEYYRSRELFSESSLYHHWFNFQNINSRVISFIDQEMQLNTRRAELAQRAKELEDYKTQVGQASKRVKELELREEQRQLQRKTKDVAKTQRHMQEAQSDVGSNADTTILVKKAIVKKDAVSNGYANGHAKGHTASHRAAAAISPDDSISMVGGGIADTMQSGSDSD